MIELLNPYVPAFVGQDMLWIADYGNNSYFSEIDLETLQENDFYKIDKNALQKFGLVGLGYNCYFDIFGGIFNINGRKINIRLITDTDVHFLTGANLLYNDIITYKIANAKFSLDLNNKEKKSGEIATESDEMIIAESSIDSFNLGYKQKIFSNGVNFFVEFIAHFPYDSIPTINIKIVSDQDVKGNLVVMVDNSTSISEEAFLQANKGGRINWQMAL